VVIFTADMNFLQSQILYTYCPQQKKKITFPYFSLTFNLSEQCFKIKVIELNEVCILYRGAGKSLARPGRKQATVTNL